MADMVVNSVNIYTCPSFAGAGSVDVPILRIEVSVTGETLPFEVNRFIFQNNSFDSILGYTIASIAKLYYTGTTNIFSTGTQVGNTVTNPITGNNTITIAPGQLLTGDP